MADRDPLSDDDIEAMLHDMMQRLAEARFATKAATPRGEEALRLAMVGPFGALMRLEKLRTEDDKARALRGRSAS